MRTTAKISVSVDRDTLAEVRELLGPGVTLSSIIDECLHDALKHLRLLKYLAEWDEKDPPTEADREWAREKLRSIYG